MSTFNGRSKELTPKPTEKQVALIITDDDARRLLSMSECIDAMRTTFKDFAEHKAVSLPRVRYTIDTEVPGRIYYANVHVGAVPSYGIACVRAGTHLLERSGLDANRRVMRNPEPFNWTVVILYDINTSEPVALMHESHVSGVRVGATSGAAVSEMAADDASVLGLFGTGRQAQSHLEAICAVRPIRRVNVFSPNPAHLKSFVDRQNISGVEVIAAKEPREVARGANIVCCTTNGTTPAFFGDWLEDGQMIISIVNSDQTITRREVDEATFARSSDIVINDWESVHHNQQIELLEPIEKGLVDKSRVHLLGDVLNRKVNVKAGPGRIVYYKNNTGLAMQFAACGAIIYRKLKEQGTNRVIPREWLASEQYGIG
jgi:ornithine cyclodeaminase/alanine dehydrogenase-like protein (mu-crystallin family)